MALPSRSFVPLLAFLWLASSNDNLVSAADYEVDPISFLGTSNRRRLQKSTTFRAGCLYDIVVYMNILGGSVNSYNQLLFAGPTTPGGTLTLGNSQTAEGGSPTHFDLLDGGHTAGVRIEWNTQTCGFQTVDLTAAIDSFEYGPENRIVCGGGLFTVFLKMRAFLQNPECLLEDSVAQNLKTKQVIIDSTADNEEACIFQVSKYADYSFENYAHLKSMAGNFEFTQSPQTDCSTEKTECDTFQLYQYDGDKYLATLTSTHSQQCVANHETTAPVMLDNASPWANIGSSTFEDGSFRTTSFCDGSEGFADSNVGAAYSWWMTVHVLNGETCTSLKTATTVVVSSAEDGNTTSDGDGDSDGGDSDGGNSTRKLWNVAEDSKPSSSRPLRPTVTLFDLDFFLSVVTDEPSSTKNQNTNTRQKQQQKSAAHAAQGQVFGSILMLLLGVSWMVV